MLFHKTPGLPAKRPTDGRGRGAVFPFLGSQFEMRLEVQVYMDQHQTDQFWLEAKAVEWELRIYTLQKRKTTKSQNAISAATGSFPLSKWLFEFGGNSCKTVALAAPMPRRLFLRAGISLSGQRPI